MYPSQSFSIVRPNFNQIENCRKGWFYWFNYRLPYLTLLRTKWKRNTVAKVYYKRLPRTSDGGVTTPTEERIRRRNSDRFETGAIGRRAVLAAAKKLVKIICINCKWNFFVLSSSHLFLVSLFISRCIYSFDNKSICEKNCFWKTYLEKRIWRRFFS